MTKLEVFDPAMCCSTGVCGPGVDPNLTRMASAVYSLEQNGIDVKRYNLANEPAAFIEQTRVNELLQSQGPDILPVTLLDGEVMKQGDYPTNEELAKWLQLEESALTQKPRIRLQLKTNN